MKHMYFCPSCNKKWSFEGMPSNKLICPDCRKTMIYTRYGSTEFEDLPETEQEMVLLYLRRTSEICDVENVKNMRLFHMTILGALLCAILAYLLIVDNHDFLLGYEWWGIALYFLFVIVLCVISGVFMSMISILFTDVLFCKMFRELDKEYSRNTFLENHKATTDNLSIVSMIIIFLICVVIIRYRVIFGI